VNENARSWALWVLVRGESEAVTNALRFATKEEADAYGVDLDCRWLVPKTLESRPSADPVNYSFIAGKLEAVAVVEV